MENITTNIDDNLTRLLKAEREWLNEIIEKYPRQIPIQPIAEHWGCDPASVRAAIEQDATFGVYWRKTGGVNRKYLIPTGLFIQWYCKVNFA